MELTNNDKLFTFNSLPNEIQLQILKESPSFLRLNKNINTEKKLFSENYCDLDISKNELDKLLRHYPSTIVIFGVNNVSFTMYYFVKETNKKSYRLTESTYYIQYNDKFYNSVTTSGRTKHEVDIAEKINEIYNKYDFILFDAKTVYIIISNRTNCTNEKTYTLTYMDDITHFIMEDNNISYLLNRIFIENYFECSYNLFVKHRISYLYTVESSGIYFNDYTPRDDEQYDNFIKRLDNDIIGYHGKIINIMNKIKK